MTKLLLIVIITTLMQAENTKPATVWDGVYTAEQAVRGKVQYENNCAACHASDLSGSEGRPLRGEVFIRDWADKDLGRLLDRAKRMPPGAPGSLSDSTYAEILAYVLQANSFPAGSTELTVDGLNNIRVEAREGPGAVPNFSLVRSVGCLTSGPERDWTLTNATPVVRTTDEPATAEQLKALQSLPLGSETFRLMYVFPSPDAYRGHKVETKGLLIRQPGDNRINVTSIQSLASSCEK